MPVLVDRTRKKMLLSMETPVFVDRTRKKMLVSTEMPVLVDRKRQGAVVPGSFSCREKMLTLW